MPGGDAWCPRGGATDVPDRTRAISRGWTARWPVALPLWPAHRRLRPPATRPAGGDSARLSTVNVGAPLARDTGMRLPFVLPFVAIASLAAASCMTEDGEDLGTVTDGKDDAPTIENVSVTLPKLSSTGKPGVRNFYVTSSVGFRVTLAYDEPNQTAIRVTNQDDNVETASDKLVQPV